MSEETGEKTEQPTQRRLEDAWKRGQFARSAEIQTVMVLGAGLVALMFTGNETWRTISQTTGAVFGHLHDVPVSRDMLQGYFINSALLLGRCVGPVVIAAMVAGMLAGGIQSRFRIAEEALHFRWERLNAMEGAKRLFSMKSAVPTLLAAIKFTIILGLTYGVVKEVLNDPIFSSTVNLMRIGEFVVDASVKIIMRVVFALAVLAAVDYGYQFYKTNQDMMMTKKELKEEVKNSEGDQKIKGRIARRRASMSKRQMLAEVPKADVIVTNPTHLAVALRYDRKSMKAPKIVAKGSRLNALRIREIAKQHQVPIIENKPLARMMFKYGKVGGEIPAQLYAAVAEVLAWVYRVNAYRYYREQHQ